MENIYIDTLHLQPPRLCVASTLKSNWLLMPMMHHSKKILNEGSTEGREGVDFCREAFLYSS